MYQGTSEMPVCAQGDLAAPILSSSGRDDQGPAHLDDSYNEVLAGRSGVATVQVDGRGRPLPDSRKVDLAAHPTDSLVLTIDESIQIFAGRELGRLVDRFHHDWATIVVMNPSTGWIWP